MADFKQAYQLTMGHEGAYSNDPNDRGGETWKGVARKRNPHWSGWALIDAAKKRPGFPGTLRYNSELEKHVSAIYKLQYWNAINLDLVKDQRIANELFDTAVNAGVPTASLFLQRVLNASNRNGMDYPDLALDGNVGPKTIAVLNGHRRPDDVLKALNILQGAKYFAICEANNTQERFFSGWLTRVAI